ncbi:uncharacterized protein SCHCODRAFT_02611809 [Schizophyllum commune H4-8]|uniref:uncharacterized protein n=1 Tax=Schizophyllum commune (strain H4-8 / FGSC 9210) TaxID=578458 RepID=UPI002160B735|nr:uncharacterized protein SCHCODRAFT_02611809 [Schizophyllum commune H4-8]KAI5898342.1 hypothetical protein SCHCODRAFT_02611809 [Schizophyllum commune H4-8]
MSLVRVPTAILASPPQGDHLLLSALPYCPPRSYLRPGAPSARKSTEVHQHLPRRRSPRSRRLLGPAPSQQRPAFFQPASVPYTRTHSRAYVSSQRALHGLPPASPVFSTSNCFLHQRPALASLSRPALLHLRSHTEVMAASSRIDTHVLPHNLYSPILQSPQLEDSPAGTTSQLTIYASTSPSHTVVPSSAALWRLTLAANVGLTGTIPPPSALTGCLRSPS